jgi:hypothetical protein
MNMALDEAVHDLHAAVTVGAPLDGVAMRLREMLKWPAPGTSETTNADLWALVADLEQACAESEQLHPDLRAQILKRIRSMRCE